MRVFIPTKSSNIVEKLFAGWNGPKLYVSFCPVFGGWLVTTTMPYDFGCCRDKSIGYHDFVIS